MGQRCVEIVAVVTRPATGDRGDSATVIPAGNAPGLTAITVGKPALRSSNRVAVALWPTLGHAVLGWLALAYFIAGAGLLWWLRERLRHSPPLLADTLAELRVDAALLRGEADPRPPNERA